MSSDLDYYELLGVPRNASESEIKKALVFVIFTSTCLLVNVIILLLFDQIYENFGEAGIYSLSIRFKQILHQAWKY
jgi:hypothetical protein